MARLRSEPKIEVGFPVEWKLSAGLVPYERALAEMESRVAAIRQGLEPELVWLLEHPPLYTAGTSASDDELLDTHEFPVHKTGRGGRYTYHGPGQRVGYVMMDLKRRGPDVRAFVHHLEEWLIVTLAQFGVKGERRTDRIGIWIEQPDGTEEKIAALGLRIRRWVSFHGIALNVAPDLTHYNGIVPCGIADYGVTSLAALGVEASMEDVDRALRSSFEEIFPD